MRNLIFAFLIAFVATPAIAEETDKPAAEKTVAAKEEFKPPPGYKTRHRGDSTIYCRKTTEIGSRFPVEKCFTQEQLKIELERIAQAKEEFDGEILLAEQNTTVEIE